jgi:myb proto-oncogene protein
VAESLPERTGKQCRERWHNHLGAGIKKGEWTEEEDRIIITMKRTIGNQWAKVRWPAALLTPACLRVCMPT